MHFRFRPTQHVFTHGYIGLFWASYINAPEDKSIYFRFSPIGSATVQIDDVYVDPVFHE